jgi:hypothetical protein
MRHAVLWEVMDNSSGENRRDWNQDIFDLYQGRSASGDEKWTEIEKQRLSGTSPSLSLEDYAGSYQSQVVGEITIAVDGRGLVLKTPKVEFSMTHWHLDTFLVEYPPWGLREFAEFRVGPKGKIIALDVFGESFARENSGGK